MSDSNNGVYLVTQVGQGRLTVGSDNVAGLIQHLNDLAEVDPVDQVSALNTVLDHVETITAAVAVKFGTSPNQNVRATAFQNQPASSGPPSDVPSCAHGPMRWKEGRSAKTGKDYKGWFCTAAYGQQQCEPQFIR